LRDAQSTAPNPADFAGRQAHSAGQAHAMTLSAIIKTGLSAMQAAQTGMRVASQNISNANTAGYIRTEITLSPLTNLGAGAGVEVSSIQRAADKFLATAAYIAEANSGGAAARSSLLARAQTYFGDPNSSSSVFSSIDAIWSALTELQVDASSALSRDKVVSAIQSAFDVLGQTANQVQSLIAEADERIGDAVSEAQSLMTRIASLNDEVRLTMRAGADPSAVQNTQSALIDQLSKLLDIRVEQTNDGGVTLRTSGGALLVGAQAAQIAYTPSGSAFTQRGVISLNAQLGTQTNLEPYILGGEIAGLLQARDEDLPSIAESLGGFAAALADKLNKVHNENSSSPAATELVGRQTGLLGTDADNFTGRAIVGIVDEDGFLTQRLTIDFDNNRIDGVSPAGPYNFATNTISGVTAALNAALAAASPGASATFTNGVLTIDGGDSGIVIQQDESAPSARSGRGFSHFFGLNDIASRPAPLFFEAGVSLTDTHGFTGDITFMVRDGNGRFAAQRTVTLAGAGDINALLTQLNANTTGLGEYATFGLDSTGRLTMTPKSGYEPVIRSDSTTRGGTAVSLSSLFGLTPAATAGRAFETNVTSALASDPGRLAVASPDISGAVGERVIELGDNRGSAELAAIRDTSFTFAAAGALSAQTTTIGLYASRLGGVAGRMAGDADNAARGASAVAAAATDRRAQVEGVTIDEELLRMTTYQNAYAAAARVIQAANDMFDVLFSIGLS
jgi:flagellar hook-associated protein 1 FlgK